MTDEFAQTELSNGRYHESISGSILLPLPKNSSLEIFNYLRHANFDQFQRCFNVYHQELIHMRNEHGQTILHVLTIHAYPYQWIRALLMRGCDPCWQDNDGYTAVHYAIERDDLEIFKALTIRFSSEMKFFSEETINGIHENCLKALSVREKDGLTGFMLACFQQSFKCLNYLLRLQINDVHLQDNHGDTCLHYAVSHRNQILVNQLVVQCQANINGGDPSRPSVLDIVQFNREQQSPFARNLDDSIEQFLLSHHASNRCYINRTSAQHKRPIDDHEDSIDSRTRTARNYARLAVISQMNGDISTGKDFYQRAINIVPIDTSDWTDYAFQLAMIHHIQGENQIALDLLQQALTRRKQWGNQTEEIDRIECAIKRISS